MATARYTVIWEQDGRRHKLTRLFIGSDGSYYVTCPYHEAERVVLSKRRVNYPKPPHLVSEPLEVAVFQDDDRRMKLSHHPSGFVQFSGEGIVSGRDDDGNPKGLGVQSFPLNRPTAGPAMGVTIQNPGAFKEAGAPRKGDRVFSADEFFMATEDTGLIIELYYFSPHWRRFVHVDSEREALLYKHPSGAILDLRICRGPSEGWDMGFVGIDVFTGAIHFGDADSGFGFSSPTGNVEYNDDDELEGDAIFAMYPGMSDENLKAKKIDLYYPPKEDPPYTKGGKPPSAD